jgi:hypothetical protein
MSVIQTGNRTHDTTVNTAEMTRQIADDKARATFVAGGTDAAYAAALRTNSITYYRAVVASCVANGLSAANFEQALRDLGTGGA